MTSHASVLGRAAERAVRDYLVGEGWAIVATNLRFGALELDIVARKERVVAVVEVRTRGRQSWSSAFGSIDRAKRQRIRSAGLQLWSRRYRSDASVERIRFDAASVSFDRNGRPQVEYVVAAF